MAARSSESIPQAPTCAGLGLSGPPDGRQADDPEADRLRPADLGPGPEPVGMERSVVGRADYQARGRLLTKGKQGGGSDGDEQGKVPHVYSRYLEARPCRSASGPQ